MQSQVSEAKEGSRARCAIVHAQARAGEAPRDPGAAELAAAMGRRGLDVLWCRDAYSAMAELAVHERALRRGECTEPMIVVLCDAAHLAQAPALFDASARLAPHAVIWRYDAGANPALAAFHPGARVDPVAARQPAGRGTQSAPARLEPDEPAPLAWPLKIDPPQPVRAVPEPAAKPSPAAAAPQPARPTQMILTEEELAMLLGDEGADEAARAREKRK